MDKILVVTPEERDTFKKLLLLYFPWLESDESVSGAEIVDTLNQLYNTLNSVADPL